VFWAFIEFPGFVDRREGIDVWRATFAYPTLRKEREGWERIPQEEQMFLPAVAAWGTRPMVMGIEPGSD
jgi:hypothetical protein